MGAGECGVWSCDKAVVGAAISAMATLLLLMLLLATTTAEVPYNKIFGGEEVKAGQMLHQAAVGYKGYFWFEDVSVVCGGSVIHTRFVLSAAHCWEAGRPMVVMVGSLDMDLDQGFWYDISEVFAPDDWVNGTFDYDALLLQVFIVQSVSKVGNELE